VLAGFQDGPLRTLLAWAPLRWLGRISYAAYLYHWPFYLVLTPDRLGIDGMPLLALRMGVTLAAAHLSTSYLEEPIRRRRVSPNVTRFALAPVAIVVVLAIATMPSVPVGTGPSGVPVANGHRVAAAPGAGAPAIAAPEVEPVRRLLLVGDSITNQAAPFFAARFPRADVRWVGRNGMGLLTEQGRLLDVLADAVADFDPDVVLIDSVGSYTDNDPGPAFIAPDGTPVADGSDLMFDLWKQQARRAVDLARARGARVIWATTAPVQERSYFGALASRVERLNTIYRDLDHVTVVDWWSATAQNGQFAAELRSASGDTRTARSIDGLHFTEFGNELLVDIAQPAIAAYPGRTPSSTG
jgi:hypothetical protein